MVRPRSTTRQMRIHLWRGVHRLGLRDPQREHFAVLVGTGQKDEIDAYLEAFEVKSEITARKYLPDLLAEPDVQERIRQAQQEVLHQTAVNEAVVVSNIYQIGVEALEKGKLDTALRAFSKLGEHKALNLWSRNVNHNIHHDVADRIKGMSYEEKAALAIKLRLVEGRNPDVIEAEIVQ